MGMTHFDVSVQLGHEDGGALVMAARLVATDSTRRMGKRNDGDFEHISRFSRNPRAYIDALRRE